MNSNIKDTFHWFGGIDYKLNSFIILKIFPAILFLKQVHLARGDWSGTLEKKHKIGKNFI